MSRPNPDDFARQTLWHLNLIRAELLEQTELIIPLAAEKLGRSEDDLGEQFVRRVNVRAEVLYRQALKASGLREDLPPPPLPPGRAINPRV